MNAHIQHAEELKENDFDYVESKSKAQRNTSGHQLITICKDSESKILNNCIYREQRRFPNELTYKKGARWVSELDFAVASKNMIEDIVNFSIINTDLKSDHKPISVTLRTKTNSFLTKFSTNLLHFSPTAT